MCVNVYICVMFVSVEGKASNADSAGASQASQPKGRKAFNIGKDCIVGLGVQIGPKTNIKKSTIGKYCKIGEKCRISNCILMDHVIIEDMVSRIPYFIYMCTYIRIYTCISST